MVSTITAASDLFVLSHLGIPDIRSDEWTITVDGMVAKPRSFTLNELRAMPSRQVEVVHQCAGNPMTPNVPARRASNVVWRGVDLRDLLHACGVQEQATFVWSYGADHGEFAEIACDFYLKDLPMGRIREGDVLLAYELNGAPIPRHNGFPLRLVVPGFYATNSVKWVYRLTVSDRRASGPFTTRFYNDAIADAPGYPQGRVRPVWDIAPESLIVTPSAGRLATLGSLFRIWGWAWGSEGVAGVEVSTDGGTTWHEAEVERRGRWSWNRFHYDWMPMAGGHATIISRATGQDGERQPEHGWRNAVHRVDVEVC